MKYIDENTEKAKEAYNAYKNGDKLRIVKVVPVYDKYVICEQDDTSEDNFRYASGYVNKDEDVYDAARRIAKQKLGAVVNPISKIGFANGEKPEKYNGETFTSRFFVIYVYCDVKSTMPEYAPRLEYRFSPYLMLLDNAVNKKMSSRIRGNMSEIARHSGDKEYIDRLRAEAEFRETKNEYMYYLAQNGKPIVKTKSFIVNDQGGVAILSSRSRDIILPTLLLSDGEEPYSTTKTFVFEGLGFKPEKIEKVGEERKHDRNLYKGERYESDKEYHYFIGKVDDIPENPYIDPRIFGDFVKLNFITLEKIKSMRISPEILAKLEKFIQENCKVQDDETIEK